MLADPTDERLNGMGCRDGQGLRRPRHRRHRRPVFRGAAWPQVDREAAERDNRRLATRLKFAELNQHAAVEDIDMRTPRSIDRALFQKLVAGDWIERAECFLDHRADRRRQELDCLRARS